MKNLSLISTLLVISLMISACSNTYVVNKNISKEEFEKNAKSVDGIQVVTNSHDTLAFNDFHVKDDTILWRKNILDSTTLKVSVEEVERIHTENKNEGPVFNIYLKDGTYYRSSSLKREVDSIKFGSFKYEEEIVLIDSLTLLRFSKQRSLLPEGFLFGSIAGGIIGGMFGQVAGSYSNSGFHPDASQNSFLFALMGGITGMVTGIFLKGEDYYVYDKNSLDDNNRKIKDIAEIKPLFFARHEPVIFRNSAQFYFKNTSYKNDYGFLNSSKTSNMHTFSLSGSFLVHPKLETGISLETEFFTDRAYKELPLLFSLWSKYNLYNKNPYLVVGVEYNQYLNYIGYYTGLFSMFASSKYIFNRDVAVRLGLNTSFYPYVSNERRLILTIYGGGIYRIINNLFSFAELSFQTETEIFQYGGGLEYILTDGLNLRFGLEHYELENYTSTSFQLGIKYFF